MLDHIDWKIWIALLYRLLTLCLFWFICILSGVSFDRTGRSRLSMLSPELRHLLHLIDIEERLAGADGRYTWWAVPLRSIRCSLSCYLRPCAYLLELCGFLEWSSTFNLVSNIFLRLLVTARTKGHWGCRSSAWLMLKGCRLRSRVIKGTDSFLNWWLALLLILDQAGEGFETFWRALLSLCRCSSWLVSQLRDFIRCWQLIRVCDYLKLLYLCRMQVLTLSWRICMTYAEKLECWLAARVVFQDLLAPSLVVHLRGLSAVLWGLEVKKSTMQCLPDGFFFLLN